MKFNQKILVVAIAAALPWVGAHAQSNADLLRQIEALKAQLEALSAKVEAVSRQSGAVNPQEFNRLVQKVDLAEESSIASGFKGLKFKGVIEAAYLWDQRQQKQGFVTTNGHSQDPTIPSVGMFEISKEVDDGVSWTLRLSPGNAGLTTGGGLIHEATVAVPFGESGAKLIAGLMPDWQGYEYYFGHQNPLVTHNLLFGYAAASTYEGVGTSNIFGKLATKWMLANIDNNRSGKAPGVVYRGDYTVSEYTYFGFAGAHARTQRRFDMVEVDAGYTRGDWVMNGQLTVGRERGIATNGGDAKWWGASALAGYKLTPALQFLGRFDYINNRKNGGGIYVIPLAAGGVGDPVSGFGPELDNTGAAVDPNRGANRYSLSAGFNYAVNANTAWKTELRLDRSSGFNFTDLQSGLPKRSNAMFGTSIVVSF